MGGRGGGRIEMGGCGGGGVGGGLEWEGEDSVNPSTHAGYPGNKALVHMLVTQSTVDSPLKVVLQTTSVDLGRLPG